MYTTPSGYISKGTFFKKIEKGRNYIMGVDVAKGRGQDYSTIEIIEYETMNHIFEFKDNHIQHDDLVKTINNVVITILKNKGNICLGIESNMTGSAVINDLISLNPMYRNIIYKNTIGVDINKNNNKVNTPYYNCNYGIEVTTAVRDLLINYIFRFIDKNISLIKSKELMNEIESLEIDSKGKIQGIPHDDLVFAFGHALLIKYRARIQNLLSIFNMCDDIRKDPSYIEYIDMSLDGFNNEEIRETFDATNDNIFLTTAGFTNNVYNTFYDNNTENNIAENNNNILSMLNNNSLQIDKNGNINSLQMQEIHTTLMEQTKFLLSQRPLKPIRNNNINKKNKKEEHYYSDDFNGKFESQYDPALDWMANII